MDVRSKGLVTPWPEDLISGLAPIERKNDSKSGWAALDRGTVPRYLALAEAKPPTPSSARLEAYRIRNPGAEHHSGGGQGVTA